MPRTHSIFLCIGLIAVRLPKSQEDLAPVILEWAEKQYASEK